MAAFGVDTSVSGAGQVGGYVGGQGDDTHPDGQVFGPGTVGRWMLIEWIIATVWLIIVWRIIDGY